MCRLQVAVVSEPSAARGADDHSIAPLRRSVNPHPPYTQPHPSASDLAASLPDRAITNGDMFLGGLLVSSLSKLAVRALELHGPKSETAKDFQVTGHA